MYKKYLAEFVYGATDGVVTTFAIIAGTIGAGLDPVIILFLGISNLLADGFSMAASNYLSVKSQIREEGSAPLEPFKTAVVTFVAFVIVGSVSILPFILAQFIPGLVEHQFVVAILATALAFIFIGAVRGRVRRRNVVFTAFETLLIGGVAALIAYGVGGFVRTLVG